MADDLQLGFTFEQAIQRRIWTVRDLVTAVRTRLEREYSDVWVDGEISNYRPAGSGHLYFTLKQDGAQIRAVMFRTQARLLKFRPDNGLQVLLRGRVTIYDERGELQILAEYIEPKGAGALQVAFEQLKAKLAAEGLFDPSLKKPLPSLPKTIGVVTSPRGAALQDILNILRRRHETVNVLIYPAQVQGDYAAAEVAAGLRYFNRAKNVDVIIVARGGGSIEDLAAFNDEGLARSVAASELPVISAVGHETDFTICDFVADLRAPTPSAAAELVVRSKHELEDRVTTLRQRLARGTRYQIMRARQELMRAAQHGAFARMMDQIQRRHAKVDDFVHRLAAAERGLLRRLRQRLDVAATRVTHHDFRRQLTSTRRVLDAETHELGAAMRARLFAARSTLDALDGRLQALSPVAILDRGYSLVFDASGNLVRSVEQVKPGDAIRARLSDGEIRSTVDSLTTEHTE